MKPLDGCLLAFVAHESPVAARAEVLRLAGATVRMSSPQLDLWAALGDGAFDALVLVASAGVPAPSAILASLGDDPRTRTIPVVVLLEAAFAAEFVRSAGPKSAVVVSTEVSDEGLVKAVVEVTSREREFRELEAQHRMLQEQVRSLATRADESRTELHDVAHDLRALLGISYGFACNLRDEVVGPLNGEQQEHVSRILEAGRDASGLLERTRDSTRMRALSIVSMLPESTSVRPGRAQRTMVDLAALAASVKSLFEPSAHAQGKKLRLRTEPIGVWGDALKLKQVLTNLVVNAIKYSPPRGDIDVVVRWAEPTEASGPGARKRAEIAVTNTGPGIAPEFRERIFERGFRLDRHAHLPGKGVGLSIVREVVAQHRGSVRVDGGPDESTTFVVSLPYDMRVREKQLGVLFVPESEAAAVIIDEIRSANPDEMMAMMADRPREFLDLAAACGAVVVVPRDKASSLADALAEILTPGSLRPF